MELEYGPFQRRVSLAEDVDPDRAEAHYERGQLTIVMPLARKPAVGRILIVLGERRGERERVRARADVDEEEIEVPSTLPVLPLKETVVFPQSMTPLAIGQERSIELVDEVAAGDGCSRSSPSRNEEVETPGWDDLHEIGTAAVVHKLIRVPDGTLRILVQGVEADPARRAASQDEPYLIGEFERGPRGRRGVGARGADAQRPEPVRAHHRAVPYLPEELQLAVANIDDPSVLCYLVASTLRLKAGEKQQLLEHGERRGAAARRSRRSSAASSR